MWVKWSWDSIPLFFRLYIIYKMIIPCHVLFYYNRYKELKDSCDVSVWNTHILPFPSVQRGHLVSHLLGHWDSLHSKLRTKNDPLNLWRSECKRLRKPSDFLTHLEDYPTFCLETFCLPRFSLLDNVYLVFLCTKREEKGGSTI